ncbi:MAG: DUF2239 family protein [Pseudomonadota bacterium]|nr:DUF2239 family protein [Pseudomonadota bacterium]
MTDPAVRYSPDTRCTAFLDDRRIAAGELRHVALRARDALQARPDGQLQVFDDNDASLIDLDLRAGVAEIVQQLNRGELPLANRAVAEEKRRRGRPRLGVIAREITLLPAHWQWLNAQPGGASVALRALVDAARDYHHVGADPRRAAQARAYRFIAAIGAERPGFEAASRALFAADAARFEAELAGWPDDLRDHALLLASAVWPV